ncbi:MAG TPA: DUF5672 family protein [Mucilaginibacter sp.]|jgi:hypothetical protein|nr:DUF5672 family protein [Mucilaginibacter sp.]
MHKEGHSTNRVAVVIPIYKNKLEAFEELALDQCVRVLKKHKMFVVKPRSLVINILNEHDFVDYIPFDDKYFESRHGYNQLMLWEGFYEKFLNFQYILIYQLDAFVFTDRLLEWCDKGYDYIGAPWLRPHQYIDVFKAVKSKLLIAVHTWFNIKQPNSDLPTEIQFENKVGNGGLSLRRVQKFYDACRQHRASLLKYLNRTEHYFNEDVWWGIELNRKSVFLKIPDYKKAIFFSFENEPERAWELTGGELPFGCHAWNLHMDFWERHFAAEAVFKRKVKSGLYVASLNPGKPLAREVKEFSLVPKAV